MNRFANPAQVKFLPTAKNQELFKKWKDGCDEALKAGREYYEKVRDRSGTGAALLRHRRCGAFQIVLSSTDLDRVRAAAPDDVVRCEECQRILVRTPESGL